MYDMISDLCAVKPLVSFQIKLESIEQNELLKNWLSEALSCFHVRDILLSRFDVKNINDIINAVDGSGISKKICRMRPLGVIKG
jgi:SHS2 domain-containing protein